MKKKYTVPYFTRFNQAVEIPSPELFPFPFYNNPHPISLLAASQLQNHIQANDGWNHDFGDESDMDSYSIGKMFGVLVVQNEFGELGYLSAFSGKLADSNHLPGFVPPVFDMLEEGNFFMIGMKDLNQIQKEVKAYEALPEFVDAQSEYKRTLKESQHAIKALKLQIKQNKAARKQKRIDAKDGHPEYDQLLQSLATESQLERIKYKNTQRAWKEKVDTSKTKLDHLKLEYDDLKKKRSDFSSNLQNQLFEHYQFLNIKGEVKTLNDIFSDVPTPAGAGECAAPKLLHYAFGNNLKPIALAEFWWGKSPKSAIRKHGLFYPSCKSKCEPILGHMLQGIKVEENPMHNLNTKAIEVIYDDDDIIVINKPSGILSVPGKELDRSAETYIRNLYPDKEGPFVVHRLDMATSGILVFTKHKEAYTKLQEQFIRRTVKKRYVAILDGVLTQDSGVINLPIRVDLDDRPRQLVCREHGKEAITRWKVLERKNNKTKVNFYPITGRTHQLRVHAAHRDGLNIPIVGDVLYGSKSDRLLLHAESLKFVHPITNEKMHFKIQSGFEL